MAWCTRGWAAAKVPDVKLTAPLLHGEAQQVHGDKGYTTRERNRLAGDPASAPRWCFPFKRVRGRERPEDTREINHRLSPPRARVEHPFGYTKGRYRGLARNTAPLPPGLRCRICTWRGARCCVRQDRGVRCSARGP